MSRYISLFEHWQKALKIEETPEEVLEKVIGDLKKAQVFLNNTLFIQDYRDFGVRFATDNAYSICGYHPEHFYANGIEAGLQLLHPNDLPQLLLFQKEAFEFLNLVPVDRRHSIEIRYYARVYHKVRQKYNYLHAIITPLLFDKKGQVILDIANWQNARPVHPENEHFHWSLSYRDDNDELISKTNLKSEVDLDELSPAENKVLGPLLEGKNSVQIAEALHISRHTVDTHRRHILKKMGVSSTIELVALLKSTHN